MLVVLGSGYKISVCPVVMVSVTPWVLRFLGGLMKVEMIKVEGYFRVPEGGGTAVDIHLSITH